jgi:hypothetical protein
MPEITVRGRKLARKLNPAIGTTYAIEETCSLIARHAVTHHHLQEALCNGFRDYRGNWDEKASARAEKQDAQLEARITRLVENLPHTDEGAITVKFGGDPRGCTVKLVMPGELAKLHDDWGQEGICV